jgi:ATPase subunit of ABC transporter with duplicated ATPase domains
MLARLMAQRADCLFLDEPTNDLDIASREALEDVLAEYDGALFVVSHDRYLLKRLGDRVVAIRGGAAHVVPGDYETYERHQHALSSPAPADGAASVTSAAPAAPAAAKPNRHAAHEAKLAAGRRKRAVSDAEARVARLDAERKRLEDEFTASELYDDPQRVVELQHALERTRAEIETAMTDWEAAVEAFDAGG